ncbi:MAG: hypothetical protein J0I71_14280 [Rhodanobacter sp.]|jgi:hypothetical protein|uniref:Lipoprotein n=2 Tax=unclassified Rhodanobacter TaxID=2621553 RepID=A0AB74UNC6_9GAMM|nr:hypothetical protein [Rhodanobacter sp.]MBN8946728.1 hypothetical protein [Rhodanobacter sp.]OJW33135.1 MAG: hypothetical protein BGO50_15010 [Rhodanobacter sp. 67-28]
MKFESIFLTMLFVACSSVCVLVMGAMLAASPSSSQQASARRAAPAVAVQADCAKPVAMDVCGADEV